MCPSMLVTTVSLLVEYNMAFSLCKRKDVGVYLHIERGSEIQSHVVTLRHIWGRIAMPGVNAHT